MFCFFSRSFAAVGVDPAVMGVGPAAAIPVAVKSAGLELDDVDLFEINEVLGFYDACTFIAFTEFYPSKLSNFFVLLRHLHPSMYIAQRNWGLILRRSMSMEVRLL